MVLPIKSKADKFWIHKGGAEIALPCKKFNRLVLFMSAVGAKIITDGEHKGSWQTDNAHMDAYLTPEDKVQLYDIMGELYIGNE